ncbi:hypothetical protein CerSpe_215530 [Prunus speciosa]
MDCLQNPNPSSAGPYHFGESIDPSMDFDEFSDYFMLDYGVNDHQDSSSLSIVSTEKFMADRSTGSSGGATSRNSNNNMKCRNEGRRNKIEMGHRVAFRTKSELEVMDDGFKWRKYGKKSVKNSPNPRNYYKCSSGGCNVKKRVERDREDSSYVITTYDGVHNHESPCVVYYNQMPTPVDPNNIWTLRASSQSSASS